MPVSSTCVVEINFPKQTVLCAAVVSSKRSWTCRTWFCESRYTCRNRGCDLGSEGSDLEHFVCGIFPVSIENARKCLFWWEKSQWARFSARRFPPLVSSSLRQLLSADSFYIVKQTWLTKDESFKILLRSLSPALVPFRRFVHQFVWRAVPYCRCRSSCIVHVSKFTSIDYFIFMGVCAGISDSKKYFHSRLNDRDYCSQVKYLLR